MKGNTLVEPHQILTVKEMNALRKLPVYLFLTLMILSVAPSLFAQIRVRGTVTNEEGKPIQNATVKLFSDQGGELEPIQTDKRGKWGALVPVSGEWNIDVEAEGYITSRGIVPLSDVTRTPPLKTVLQKRPEAAPQPEEPSVPPELLEAVDAGQAALQAKDFDTAVKELSKAHALMPEHVQIKQALAQAYYGKGELEPAIEMLSEVHEADPTNIGVAMLLVNLYLEDGNIEDGQKVLAELPEGSMTDPTALINIGILFMNKSELEKAHGYFNQAVEVDPSAGEPYYYRGIAALQLKKMDEAKADLEKVVELAPDSSEAADAKALLEQF